MSQAKLARWAGGDFTEFWILVWLGTAVAGGVFGVVIAFSAIHEVGFGFIYLAVVGFIYGLILAGFVAFPVVSTIAVLNWAFWLKRFAVPMAAVSGAATGIFCTALVFEETFFGRSDLVFICLAGTTGAAGAGVFGALYTIRRNGWRSAFGTGQEPWRYSLRDLFVRFTIVTLLIAGWTWAVKAYVAARMQRGEGPRSAVRASYLER